MSNIYDLANELSRNLRGIAPPVQAVTKAKQWITDRQKREREAILVSALARAPAAGSDWLEFTDSEVQDKDDSR